MTALCIASWNMYLFSKAFGCINGKILLTNYIFVASKEHVQIVSGAT
jgi:hypothetical protein